MALTVWASLTSALKRRLPPVALFMKGIGVDEYYPVEVNTTTGAIPVSLGGDVDFGATTNATRVAAVIGNTTGQADFGSGAASGQTLRTMPATDAVHLLNTRHEAVGTPLSVRISDGSSTFGAFGYGVNSAALRVAALLGNATGALDYGSGAASAQTLRAILATDQQAIPITDGGGSITVDGIVVAMQSGAWNINNISGTVSLPTGAATEATLATIDTDTGNIATSVASIDTKAVQQALNFGVVTGAIRTAALLGNASGIADFGSGAVSAQTIRTTPASDSPHLLATRHETNTTPLAVRLSTGSGWTGNQTITGNVQFGLSGAGTHDWQGTIAAVMGWDGTQHREIATDSSGRVKTTEVVGRNKVELVRNDYTSVSVTTAAYTQLIASTSSDINRLHIFDSSGETLVLATGAAASEVDQFYIPPGGIEIDLNIASGTRLSIKAISADATSGEINITALS